MFWSFSYSMEGPFYGNYETREGAIDAAVAEMTAEGKPPETVFFVGDDRPPKVDFTGLDLPEHLATWVEDFQVEQAEEWPAFNANERQLAELAGVVERAFAAWTERYGFTPDWRIVDRIETLTLDGARRLIASAQ